VGNAFGFEFKIFKPTSFAITPVAFLMMRFPSSKRAIAVPSAFVISARRPTSVSRSSSMSRVLRARREHGVQLTMIHWISEEKLLKLRRIIEKKNKTRR
jgi:hypothetical protein